MPSARNDGVTVVRVFPDYAESCLWLGEPVDYALTGLDDDFVDQLKAWEKSYYDGLTPDLAWRSDELAEVFSQTGRRLGRQLARALGDGFEVVVMAPSGGGRGPGTESFRGPGPAVQPHAEAAFRALVEQR